MPLALFRITISYTLSLDQSFCKSLYLQVHRFGSAAISEANFCFTRGQNKDFSIHILHAFSHLIYFIFS